MPRGRPINMGVQLVPRGRYPQAIAVLDAVCDKYPFNESFIAGQVLPSSFVKAGQAADSKCPMPPRTHVSPSFGLPRIRPQPRSLRCEPELWPRTNWPRTDCRSTSS
jgi:hypothetical protein